MWIGNRFSSLKSCGNVVWMYESAVLELRDPLRLWSGSL